MVNTVPTTDELPEELVTCIKKLAQRENITDYTIHSKVIPIGYSSFMGVHREITVQGKDDDKEKSLDLFVKTIKPNVDLNIYSVPGIYVKETTVYRDIFKVFNELQEEAKIPQEERYNLIKSYEGVDNESIIMENLSKRGFKMCEQMEVVPLKFVELSIQQLARFHGMAFVMQAKRPEFFEEKVKNLEQPFKYDTEAWNRFVTNATNISMSVLDPEVKKKVEAYLPTTFHKYRQYAEDATSVRTLVHGDLRPNNVMMKETNGEVTEAILIDFQGTFYGSPIIDIHNFIFSSTDPEFRKKNQENLKNMYYDSMKKFLAHFSLDVEKYYPKSEYERMFEERKDFGFMTSLWLIPIILADKGQVPDLTMEDMSNVTFKVNDAIKNRVRAAVDEFMKLGHL